VSTIITTQNRVKIITIKGKKSPNDFIVKYKEPGKRRRTPKHIHIIIDLYMKLMRNEKLTIDFVDHIINNIIKVVKPVHTYPPTLQIFNQNHVKKFSTLNNYGEYSVEFLLAVIELIIIQEKTNYANGTLNLDIFTKFRNGADIFTVVSATTFR